MQTEFPVKELHQYFKSELAKLAQSLGLDTYGTKAQLCARILGLTPASGQPAMTGNLNAIADRQQEAEQGQEQEQEIYVAVNCKLIDKSPVVGLYSTHDIAITQSYDYLKKKYGKDKKYSKVFAIKTSTIGDKEIVLDEMGIHISRQRLDEPLLPFKCKI